MYCKGVKKYKKVMSIEFIRMVIFVGGGDCV